MNDNAVVVCPYCKKPPRFYPAQVMVNGECPESIDCDNGDCKVMPSTGYLPFDQAVVAWNSYKFTHTQNGFEIPKGTSHG